MNTLGERLSAVRERRGLTQGEVARRAHLPQQAISRLERGERSHVRSDVLARLAILGLRRGVFPARRFPQGGGRAVPSRRA